MDGPFGHAANWYMQGPFVSALPEFGYQSPLSPRAVYRAGIAAVNAHCRKMFSNKSFSELSAIDQDAVLTPGKGTLDFENISGKYSSGFYCRTLRKVSG